MAQSKSISKKELDTLQGFVKEANKFQMQIGGVEAHKAQLIKALDSVSVKLSAVQKELEESPIWMLFILWMAQLKKLNKGLYPIYSYKKLGMKPIDLLLERIDKKEIKVFTLIP